MADNIASRQPGLVAVCTIMLTIAILAIVLRFWSNHLSSTHRFGYDDLFALLTLMSSLLPCVIVESSLVFWWIHLGLGRHATTLPKEHLLMGPKIIFIATFFYVTAINLPKFSILFFYHRIFQRTSSRFRYSLWAVGGLNAAWLVATWISAILQCIPVAAAWDPVIQAKGARCYHQWTWFLGTAIPSMVIDLMILILPLPRLWNLKTTWRQRITVICIFICGYSVIVVSIGRLISLAQAGSGFEEDLTWSTIPYIMWVQSEGPISLMSVSLPNIVHLVKRVYERGAVREARKGRSGPGSGDSRPIGEGRFIRLEPYGLQGVGNDTLVSSKGITPKFEGHGVSVTQEVDVIEHERDEAPRVRGPKKILAGEMV